MKRKLKSFRRGQVVRSGANAVLVTGKGNKQQDYPCFAGVTIAPTTFASLR